MLKLLILVVYQVNCCFLFYIRLGALFHIREALALSFVVRADGRGKLPLVLEFVLAGLLLVPCWALTFGFDVLRVYIASLFF